MGDLREAYNYAERAHEDVTAVRGIIATVWRGDAWTPEREDEIRDYLGDAMGAIVAVAETLGISL